MANFVTKKDGTKVPFDSEKMKASITAAALDAGLSEEEAANITQEVFNLVSVSLESQEEVATSEIKEKILSELDVSSPSTAGAWRKYEESKGQ